MVPHRLFGLFLVPRYNAPNDRLVLGHRTGQPARLGHIHVPKHSNPSLEHAVHVLQHRAARHDHEQIVDMPDLFGGKGKVSCVCRFRQSIGVVGQLRFLRAAAVNARPTGSESALIDAFSA